MSGQITSLHSKMIRYFNLDELSLLCFTLEIDFEELAGNIKSKKVQSLLEYVVRHGAVEKLLTQLEVERSHVAWRVGPPEDLVNPYKGLNAFTVEDKKQFFGRNQVTASLMAMVRKKSFITVLGASGSGKSSLVFAGLAAGMAAENAWLTIDCRPGKEPFLNMAGALLEPLVGVMGELLRFSAVENLAGMLSKKPEALGRVLARILEKHPGKQQLLLIIDQFEELYTLVSEVDIRNMFVNSLLAARDVNGIHFVVTMRADFLGQALIYPPLVAALQNHNVMLGPMSTSELRTVIAEPAKRVGVSFEPGLEERILNDVVDEPGYLPLLQFALTWLWEEQQDGRLTHTGYEEIGGVAGALVQYADETLESLDESEQETARQVFTRLVRPGLGTEDTRQVAIKNQLAGEWELTQWLADRRLVVTGRNELEEETAEIVHEALIQRWGKLREWLEEDREFLTWREGLGTAVTLWTESNGDEAVLLRGSVLATAETWLTEHQLALSSQEQAFIKASVAYRDAKIVKEKERQERELKRAKQIADQQKELAKEQHQRAEEEKKRANLFRRALTGGGVLILFLLAAIVFAVVQWNSSQDNLKEANVQRLRSEARALAAESGRVMGTNRTQALALAVQAVHETFFASETCEIVVSEAEIALAQTLFLPGVPSVSLDAHTGDVRFAVFSPNGRLIVTTSSDTSAKVWDVQTGDLITSLDDHTGVVTFASFNPDGSRIVTASSDTTAKVWDAQTGAHLHSLDDHTGYVSSATFSPDGERIVTASSDTTAKVWDAETGALILSIDAHLVQILSAAFSPDGEQIATASIDNTAKVWDAETGLLITSLEGHTGEVQSLAFSTDGKYIITASKDSTAKVWDIPTGSLVASLDEHTNEVSSATFSPDGKYIATAGLDDTAKLWDVQTWELMHTLEGHAQGVNSAVFSPGGDRVVTASSDTTAKVWNVQTGKLITSLDDHTNLVSSAVFSPDGVRIVTASMDETAKVWDEMLINSLEDHAREVLSAAISSDGERIVTASRDRTSKVWNAQTGELIISVKGHDNLVSLANFSPDRLFIVTASPDSTSKVWNAQTGELITSFEKHTDSINSATFSPDGKRIVTAGSDTSAKVWDAQSGNLIYSLDNHTKSVNSAIFSPDGKRIVTAGSDATAKVWNAQTGDLIFSLDNFTVPVLSAIFSPDGNSIATVSSDALVKVWNAETGTLITSLDGHTKLVESVSFSPGGERIVTASLDTSAKVWDANSGELITSLDGHTLSINSAVFSPNGTRIVTASSDNSAKIWDAQTGTMLTSLNGHTDVVKSAVFSPNGQRIVTASSDSTVKVWGVDSTIPGMLAEAERRLRRLLTQAEIDAIYGSIESCSP